VKKEQMSAVPLSSMREQSANKIGNNGISGRPMLRQTYFIITATGNGTNGASKK